MQYVWEGALGAVGLLMAGPAALSQLPGSLEGGRSLATSAPVPGFSLSEDQQPVPMQPKAVIPDLVWRLPLSLGLPFTPTLLSLGQGSP